MEAMAICKWKQEASWADQRAIWSENHIFPGNISAVDAIGKGNLVSGDGGIQLMPTQDNKGNNSDTVLQFGDVSTCIEAKPASLRQDQEVISDLVAPVGVNEEARVLSTPLHWLNTAAADTRLATRVTLPELVLGVSEEQVCCVIVGVRARELQALRECHCDCRIELLCDDETKGVLHFWFSVIHRSTFGMEATPLHKQEADAQEAQKSMAAAITDIMRFGRALADRHPEVFRGHHHTKGHLAGAGSQHEDFREKQIAREALALRRTRLSEYMARRCDRPAPPAEFVFDDFGRGAEAGRQHVDIASDSDTSSLSSRLSYQGHLLPPPPHDVGEPDPNDFPSCSTARFPAESVQDGNMDNVKIEGLRAQKRVDSSPDGNSTMIASLFRPWLAGTWDDDCGPVAQVDGFELRLLPDGDPVSIHVTADLQGDFNVRCSLIVELFGEEWSGDLMTDGRIVWRSGDVWRRQEAPRPKRDRGATTTAGKQDRGKRRGR